MSGVGATTASLNSASEGLTGALQLRQQWPHGSPLWLGWVSRVYSRGMTFLDPGQGYLKECEAEPKICRASCPYRGPGFPSLESISSGKAYCAVIPVSQLLMFFIMKLHKCTNTDSNWTKVRVALYRALSATWYRIIITVITRSSHGICADCSRTP